jgi:hypothetical protein
MKLVYAVRFSFLTFMLRVVMTVCGRIVNFCARGPETRLARSNFDFSTFSSASCSTILLYKFVTQNCISKCMLFQELEGIRVKGKGCPKPIKTWAQCGVSKKELDVLKKHNYERPTPIQAQAIPAIMSGKHE